jgi:hypothetical protein
MNHQGLYWPDGRNLFRHPPHAGLRTALWFVCATVALTAVAALYFV